jgi:hypothetical protein
MNYYEPYQRLDNYNYIQKEDALYVKSSVSVLLPKGVTLMGRMPAPAPNSLSSWNLDYYYAPDQSLTEPTIYEHLMLVKVMDNVGLSKVTNTATLKQSLQNTISAAISHNGDFTVNCRVYKDGGSLGGQVTSTISTQGEVIII